VRALAESLGTVPPHAEVDALLKAVQAARLHGCSNGQNNLSLKVLAEAGAKIDWFPVHGWMLHCMPSRYIPCVACVPIRVQGRRAIAVLREASRPNRLIYSHRLVKTLDSWAPESGGRVPLGRSRASVQ
jgi:hypothetical protein